ncbi:MAG: DUF6660 family protein [Saprospiraceae bacterium]
MKRVLSFLMVLYVSFGVLHPCADALLCTITESHADADKQADDDCSPFCVCACCGISFISQIPVILVILNNTNFKSHFIYLPFFGKNFNPSFWQPPRSAAFTLLSSHRL